MSVSSISSGSVSSYYDNDFLSKIAKKVISKRDTDSDNAVSLAESGLSENKFASVDTDGDGKISSDELVKSVQDVLSQIQMPSPDRMASIKSQSNSDDESFDSSEFVSKFLEKEDTDGDGVISASETSMPSDMFSRIDADGDGNLTSDELAADLENMQKNGKMPPPPPPKNSEDSSDNSDISELISKIMQNNDTDADGKLSTSELTTSSDMFASIDTDGDGKISASELQEALEKLQKSSKHHRKAKVASDDESDSTEDSDSDFIAKAVSSTINKNDADGDGALSVSETGLDQEKFSALDKNGDGVLDSSELTSKLTDITNSLKESYSMLSSLYQMPNTNTEQLGSMMNSYSMNSFSNTQKYFMNSYSQEAAEA